MKKVELKTIEDALNYTGRKVEDLQIFKGLSNEGDAKHHEADFRLKVWVEALNKEDNNGVDWKPNFTDGIRKYELWVWIRSNPNGVGFVVVVTYYVCTGTAAGVGSRLVLKSFSVYEKLKELAKEEIEIVWTK